MLLQRLNGQWLRSLLQALPIVSQFPVMQPRPSHNQPLLLGRKRAGNQIDRIDAEDSNGVLIVGVKNEACDEGRLLLQTYG